MKCADCKFWRRDAAQQFTSDDPADAWGTCHRYAPRPSFETPLVVAQITRLFGTPEIDREDPRGQWHVDDPEDRYIAWPSLHGEDFCGEFVARQDRQAFV